MQFRVPNYCNTFNMITIHDINCICFCMPRICVLQTCSVEQTETATVCRLHWASHITLLISPSQVQCCEQKKTIKQHQQSQTGCSRCHQHDLRESAEYSYLFSKSRRVSQLYEIFMNEWMLNNGLRLFFSTFSTKIPSVRLCQGFSLLAFFSLFLAISHLQSLSV